MSRLDPLVFGVELSDARRELDGTLFDDTRDRRSLIGHGAQDVVIRALREVGFDGPWGVEILSAEHRQLPLTEALTLARNSAPNAFERATEISGFSETTAARSRPFAMLRTTYRVANG